MKTLTTFILAGALALLAQPNQLDLRQDPPTAVQSERVSSAYTGTSGATTYYYWVVTRYPIGFIVPTSPVVVGGASALGGGNSVALGWPAMTGASSYDVLRTTTNAAPSSCTCAVVLATTGTTLTDNGGALSAWPPGGLNSAGVAQAELQINNRDAGAPYITMAVRNAQRTLNYQLGILKNGTTPSYVPSGFIQPYANPYGRLACVDSTGTDCLNSEVNVIDFGAHPSSSATINTAAINAAAAVARLNQKTLLIPDVSGSNYYSVNGQLDLRDCSVAGAGNILVDSSVVGDAILVGHDNTGVLERATIEIGVKRAAQDFGQVVNGVHITNCHSCNVTIRQAKWFTSGLLISGGSSTAAARGVAWSMFTLFDLSESKYPIDITTDDVHGFVNQNIFFGGSLAPGTGISSSAIRISNFSGSSEPNNNVWLNPGIEEADVGFTASAGFSNVVYSGRFENVTTGAAFSGTAANNQVQQQQGALLPYTDTVGSNRYYKSDAVVVGTVSASLGLITVGTGTAGEVKTVSGFGYYLPTEYGLSVPTLLSDTPGIWGIGLKNGASAYWGVRQTAAANFALDRYYSSSWLETLNINRTTGAAVFEGPVTSPKISTATNCSSAASPAVCTAAAGGSVVVAAAATSVVVNTTAVTANSQVLVTFDSSLGSKLGVTCNTTPVQPTVSARTEATSFTLTVPSAPATDPACFSYSIIN